MAWEPEPPRRPKVLTMRLSDEEVRMLEEETAAHGDGNKSNTVRRILATYFQPDQKTEDPDGR